MKQMFFLATASKQKWKKIRENFRKANNLRKTKSGQAAKNFKPVRYAKELSFLTPYIQNESNSLTNLASSVTSDDEESSITSPYDEQSSITSPPSTHGSPPASVTSRVTSKGKKKSE